MIVFDYFKGSGPGFGITIVALCCLPLGGPFTLSPISLLLPPPSHGLSLSLITCRLARLVSYSQSQAEWALGRRGSSQASVKLQVRGSPTHWFLLLFPFSESAYLWGGGPFPEPRTQKVTKERQREYEEGGS